jgi:hypothetical protein
MPPTFPHSIFPDRYKRYSLGFLREAVIFTSNLNIFKEVFFRTCLLDGHVFFQAPDDLVNFEIMHRSERLGSKRIGLPSGSPAACPAPGHPSLTWYDTLPSGQKGRLRSYRLCWEQQVAQKVESGLALTPVLRAQKPIWDLQQNNLDVKMQENPMLGTLLTHGDLWSDKEGRCLLGVEKLLAQGIPS